MSHCRLNNLIIGNNVEKRSDPMMCTSKGPTMYTMSIKLYNLIFYNSKAIIFKLMPIKRKSRYCAFILTKKWNAIAFYLMLKSAQLVWPFFTKSVIFDCHNDVSWFMEDVTSCTFYRNIKIRIVLFLLTHITCSVWMFCTQDRLK